MLVFDGDCGFCTRAVEWARAHLRAPAAFDIQPWQALTLAELGLSEADVSTAAYVVDPDGTLHRGAAAAAHVLRACRTPWPLAGRAIQLPLLSALARAAYALIARHRGRLPGSTNACRIPDRGGGSRRPR